MNATAQIWNPDPVTAFRDFIRTDQFLNTGRRSETQAENPGQISGDTERVYLAMFGKFARWHAGSARLKLKPFSTLSANDLVEFIDSLDDDVDSGVGNRYLRLLERCYQHLALFPNPAALASTFIRNDGKRKSDALTFVLTDDEFKRFIAALPEHSVKEYRPSRSTGWKRRRDRAMQLMMLCAGVKVAEAVGMLMTEIPRQPETDGTLRIHISSEGKHDTIHPHWTHLRSEAVAVVLQWLDERTEMGKAGLIKGVLLFPSSPEGEPLSKATVYRQTASTFKRAGIDGTRVGGRTLRNTYAVQDIKKGVSNADLADKLGLAKEESVGIYAAAAKVTA